MGVVCQPSTFTSLELGYAFKPSTGEVLPVQEVDLRLWAFGEKTGRDPRDFGFRFKVGGEWHDVQACYLHTLVNLQQFSCVQVQALELGY